MGRTSIRLSESSNSSLTHVETEMPEGYTPKQGWYVSYVTAFILVLAAIALSTAVGLIVHFAHPVQRAPCPSTPSTAKPVVGSSPDAVTSPVTAPGTTPDWDQAWEACKNLSAARNQCLPGFDCSTTVSPGTSSPPTTAQPTPKNIRLPGDLRPSHYDLRLRPHIYSSNTSEFYFNGSMTAYFSCVSPTKVITLHAKLLHTSNQQLRSGDGKVIQVVKVTPEEDLDFLHLALEKALEANVSYELSMDFRGPIRKDLKGIYYSDYAVNGQTKYLLTSQLQTTDARKVFPCFDEPALKATFNTTIEYRPPLRTMSNTEVYHEEQLNNGWVADHYSTTPLMSTYILAFMISDFNCTKTYTTNGKLVEICARPNAMDQTDFAASIAGGMQEFFEDYHNISYPLPKTIHAAVQDFAAGAMENWGLIIYRETALLYDPDTATADQRQRVAKVISHELAHQWFGNLVTASWWDDIWLNEGFASYLENLGVNHTFPDWDLTNEMVVTKVQRVLVADSLASSRPIYQEVNSYVDISQVFDAVTYSKGASVIRMMKYFLGEETFRWGLSNYLKDRAYSTATSSDLFRFMTKQATSDGHPVDVEGVMDTWVRQMGYPVVTFTLDKVSGRVDLTQRHFLLDAAQTVDRPSPYNYKWKVPISVVTDKSSDWNNYTTGWLNEAKGAVVTNEPSAAWIIGNVKQRYYYRVNYDQANWDALVKQLQTDPEKIHVANRAQLIDDSINLGRANYVEQTLALGVSLYLKQEKQYIPWVSVARAFGYMDRMLSQTAYYGSFKQFMQKNVEPTYKIIGWNKGVNDTHLEQRLRTLITNQACHYSLPSCLKEADTQYQRWMSQDTQNASNSIDPNLRPVVYCHGVETGSQAEWEFAFRKYQEVNTGAEKSTLLRALGCTKQAWLLRRYLQEGLDETVLRRQDFHIIFRHIAANHDGRVVAWQFLQDNWPVIRKRFGDSTFALRKAVTSTTAGFSTERELKELQNFMEANPDQGNAALAFKKAVETAKSNIDWRKTNEMKIQKWLEQNTQSYSL